MTEFRLVERHRLREWMCRRLNHGVHERREEETRGTLRISTVMQRSCVRGHCWFTRERVG